MSLKTFEDKYFGEPNVTQNNICIAAFFVWSVKGCVHFVQGFDPKIALL